MLWHRQHVDAMHWTMFQAYLNEPIPGVEPDPVALEQEGAAFLAFMGAAGSTPDAAEEVAS